MTEITKEEYGRAEEALKSTASSAKLQRGFEKAKLAKELAALSSQLNAFIQKQGEFKALAPPEAAVLGLATAIVKLANAVKTLIERAE